MDFVYEKVHLISLTLRKGKLDYILIYPFIYKTTNNNFFKIIFKGGSSP